MVASQSNPSPPTPAPTPPPPLARGFRPDGSANVVKLGVTSSPLNDLYHYLLRASWKQLFLLVLVVYASVNSVFAVGYMLGGACIENARPGSFVDGFFFSVQTLATIGYGKMAPITEWAHMLVTVEALTGTLGTALMTGIVFAKFARPTARILFSRVAVIAERDGTPSLMFRMANERTNYIVEATVRVALARTEKTREGETVRRFYDLPLSRDRNVLFSLTWTVISPLTEASPLYGATLESLKAQNAEIIVSMMGLDGTTTQTIYARHAWTPAELVLDHRFVDILSRRPDGQSVVDFTRFHDVQPQPRKNAA